MKTLIFLFLLLSSAYAGEVLVGGKNVVYDNDLSHQNFANIELL